MEELVLSFHQVGPRDQTEAVRHGSKHIYTLSHLNSSSDFSKPFPVYPFIHPFILKLAFS